LTEGTMKAQKLAACLNKIGERITADTTVLFKDGRKKFESDSTLGKEENTRPIKKPEKNGEL